MLLKEQVIRFLKTWVMREVLVLLSKDEATADFLHGCLQELHLQKEVWSLDGLGKLNAQLMADKVTTTFWNPKHESFAQSFQKYVKRLQWRGKGELPVFIEDFRRKEGALPMPTHPQSTLLTLPRSLQLLLELKSPSIQGLQHKLAQKMWQLHSVAENFFMCSDVATPIVFRDLDGKKFAENTGVGWTCVWLVCSRTDSLLSQQPASASCRCWGDVLDQELTGAMSKLRSLMPWKCLPELPAVARCGWHAAACSDMAALRPPLWIDILSELDYDLDPDKALKELQLLDGRLWELNSEANRRFGSTVAVGLVNSLVLNYKAAVKARGACATVASLDRFLILPRMEGLEDFASMLEILFCNDRARGASEKGRVSLRVRHVTQLAQARGGLNQTLTSHWRLQSKNDHERMHDIPFAKSISLPI